jgi:hypothetical protein
MKTISCELWSINRLIKWTGFRLFVDVPEKPAPVRVGLIFWGWS